MAMKKQINPAFGLKLAELRRQRRLSQPELAKLSGVPVGSVRELEQGRREPLFSTVLFLARALKVKLEVFPSPLAAYLEENLLLERFRAGDKAAWDEILTHACERLRILTEKMLRLPMLTEEMLRQSPALPDFEFDANVELQMCEMRLRSTLKAGGLPESLSHFYNFAAQEIRRHLMSLALFCLIRQKRLEWMNPERTGTATQVR
jgi:transcriptional regulator with XRE-family HTH domain